MGTKCLIYCRVSSQRQVVEGHGLDGQEKRCRDYANSQGYQIVGVFPDEATSGGLFDRPEMKKLLSCLEKYQNETEKVVVVFDDLKRFARDTEVHFGLKREIYGRNGRVECPNFKFEDSPEGKFVETVMAATSELERNQNKRQVKQKMKARIELGCWPFCPPLGLSNIKDVIKGKLLTNQEPMALVFKMAIEGFACRQLGTLQEVHSFINTEFKKAGINRTLSLSGTRRVLSELLYTGYVAYEPWGVPMRKGQHEGFISLETYNLVQARFAGKEKFGFRKDFDPTFPLRQLVSCKLCGGALTGSWNKGRTQKYANYACKMAGCPNRWKVIHKNEIEDRFEALLTEAKPASETLDLAKEVLMDVWSQSKTTNEATQAQNEAKTRELDRLIKNASDGMTSTSDKVVRGVYENKLIELTRAKENLTNIPIPKYSDKEFGTATEKVISALKNPLEMWNSEYLEDKRTIFYMYFGKKLPYDKNLGFGTGVLEPSIELIRSSEGDKMRLVEMGGVEPPSGKVLRIG